MTLPTEQELNAYDMSPVAAMFKSCPEISYLYSPAGVEHYRLLRWIGEKYSDKMIFDIGTYMGLSAGCLNYSGENKVYTFDINFGAVKLNQDEEMEYIKLDSEENTPSLAALVEADIIFVDTWHNGIMERKIYDQLVAADWKGILTYDDIYYNDAMKEFWASLPEPKIDATYLGHATGTGIIEFI
jgi:hypothetical protein